METRTEGWIANGWWCMSVDNIEKWMCKSMVRRTMKVWDTEIWKSVKVNDDTEVNQSHKFTWSSCSIISDYQSSKWKDWTICEVKTSLRKLKTSWQNSQFRALFSKHEQALSNHNNTFLKDCLKATSFVKMLSCEK